MEHFLNSKCNFDELGKQLDNVGGWCWLYIGYHIIYLIGYTSYNVKVLMDLKSKRKHSELKKVYIKTFISTITSLFSIYFMYSMCKLCRAWTALIIITLVSCLQLGLTIYTS